MKLKSFIAGAVGVFLFFAGQNLVARENTFPVPDKNTSTLPAPDRDSSILPPPDQASALPAPAGPPPAPLPSAPIAAKPSVPAAESGSAAGRAEAQKPSGEQEPGAAPPSTAEAASDDSPASRRWPGSLPQTGPYFGVMLGPAFPSYYISDTEWEEYGGSPVNGIPGGMFGIALGMDFGLLIGEAEVLLSIDNAETTVQIPYSGKKDISMTGVSLHIPLLVKMDFHLGPVVLQPQVGPYFNVALGNLSMSGYGDGKEPYANPPIGLVVGGLAGLNLGRGILFVDARYEIDLGKTVAGNEPMTIWRRSAFIPSLGYQIYLGRKR